jgi:hypothetical protein
VVQGFLVHRPLSLAIASPYHQEDGPCLLFIKGLLKQKVHSRRKKRVVKCMVLPPHYSNISCVERLEGYAIGTQPARQELVRSSLGLNLDELPRTASNWTPLPFRPEPTDAEWSPPGTIATAPRFRYYKGQSTENGDRWRSQCQ